MTESNTPDWYESITTTDQFPEYVDFINSDIPTVVVREPQLEARDQHARAQLRSVPLFQMFGFDTVLHTDVWDNQYKLVDYEHLSTGDVDPSGISFPLLHVVTQEGMDEYGEETIVRKLVERSLDEGGQYVLITDTAAPKTPKYTIKPGKSIVNEFGNIVVRDYEHLSSVFLEKHLDSHVPVVDTRNMFFHAASTIHHRQNVPAGSIEDLFDYTVAPSNSPIWESARYFVRHDLENVLDDYSKRIREALRSWTERSDTQRVAKYILEVLQICDYEPEQLEKYRQRPPEHR